MKTFLVSTYEENIVNCTFDGCILKYGEEQEKNYIFNKYNNLSYDEFVKNSICYLNNKHNNEVQFLFIDQCFAYELKKTVDFKLICSNTENMIDWLNNKTIMRTWASAFAQVPPSVVLSKDEITLELLKQTFPGYNSFVAQKMKSDGGHGTYLIYNMKDIELFDTDIYLISPNFENSNSINVSGLIWDNDYILFPPSVQFIKNKVNYCGSDFISAKFINEKLIKEITDLSSQIFKRLHLLDYRGMCGIDFILFNQKVYFLELNPRFQGSSFLINQKLFEFDKSLIMLHKKCFTGTISNTELSILNSIDIDMNFYIDTNGSRVKTKQPLVQITSNYNTNSYYDYFSNIYHIMLSTYQNMIDTQGKFFKNIIMKYSEIDVKTILDCTCGIGVQSVSLSREGYIVDGSDISNNSLKEAIDTASKYNLNTHFFYADCMRLEIYTDKIYDCIISIDSALPHLLTIENFEKAFLSIYNRLKVGGVFISSYRDYAELLKTKPMIGNELKISEKAGFQYSVFKKWDWEDNIIHSKQHVIIDSKNSSKLLTSEYSQLAITKDELIDIAKKTNYSKIVWLTAKECGFYQPLLCLVK